MNKQSSIHHILEVRKFSVHIYIVQNREVLPVSYSQYEQYRMLKMLSVLAVPTVFPSKNTLLNSPLTGVSTYNSRGRSQCKQFYGRQRRRLLGRQSASHRMVVVVFLFTGLNKNRVQPPSNQWHSVTAKKTHTHMTLTLTLYIVGRQRSMPTFLLTVDWIEMEEDKQKQQQQ